MEEQFHEMGVEAYMDGVRHPIWTSLCLEQTTDAKAQLLMQGANWSQDRIWVSARERDFHIISLEAKIIQKLSSRRASRLKVPCFIKCSTSVNQIFDLEKFI